MKKLLIILLSMYAEASSGQVPQGIPYQAAAKSSSGAILANTTIGVRFTIHDSVAIGTTLYQETFTPATNTQGVFSVNVGMGTPVIGTFSAINWGTNAKFMQVEMDPAGSSSYVDMGTQKMMSVPYSLYSGNGMPAGANTGDMLYWNGSSWVKIPTGVTGQTLTNCGGVPTWMGNVIGSASVCTGSASTLSYTTIGGIWTSSNSSVATVGSSTGIVNGIASGAAIITYTLPSGCYTVQNLTVNPLPNAGAISGSSIVYVGVANTLSESISGGNWSISDTTIGTIGSATGIVKRLASGTAIITYSTSNICGTATATYPITVSSAVTIGSIYSGGVVAYILQSGDAGYSATVQHGLIAAPSDQNTGIVWWNGSNINTGALGTVIGTGFSNTNAIISSQGLGTYAAMICHNYTGGGFSDWYLPSKGELVALYANELTIGGFSSSSYYWSSSDFYNSGSYPYFDAAWGLSFTGSSVPGGFSKAYSSFHVRAIRSF